MNFLRANSWIVDPVLSSRERQVYSPTFCRLSRAGIDLRLPLNTGFQLLSFFPGQICGLVV